MRLSIQTDLSRWSFNFESLIRDDCLIGKQLIDVVVHYHLLEANPLTTEGTLGLALEGVYALIADSMVHRADDDRFFLLTVIW